MEAVMRVVVVVGRGVSQETRRGRPGPALSREAPWLPRDST